MRSQSLRIIPAGLIAGVAVALLGCASTEGRSYATSSTATGRKTAALPVKPACFRVADFASSQIWISLNNSELIVSDPELSRSYLIKLSEPVYDLKLHHHLGFEPAFTNNGCICNGFNDYLLARHSGLAGHVPIVAVRELTEPEERQLLSKYHITATELPSKGFGQQPNWCPTP
ncbi:MAG: DUF6491 family protein [Steroidobacteraceae bacterium]